MKRIVMKYLNLFVVSGLLLLATACEKELPKFAGESGWLNFYCGDDVTTEYVRESMMTGSHSFKLNSAEGQMRDTVWLEVAVMGKFSEKDRPVAFEQVMVEGANNAVSGKHYIAFDDASLADLYRVPANQGRVKLPVVVLRDPSLKSGNVILKITFKDNGYFQIGYSGFSTYTLTISDHLTRPSNWDDYGMDSKFGIYGEEKHALMIKWTQKQWDEEYISSLFYKKEYLGGVFILPKDPSYMSYLVNWFAGCLAKENEERLNDPNIGKVWQEADGTPVDFMPVLPPYPY